MFLSNAYEMIEINNGWLLYGGKPDDKKVIYCKRLVIATDGICSWEIFGYKKALELIKKDNLR